MITGDNPLTAVHVARDVEIVDREALILDLKESPIDEKGALSIKVFRTHTHLYLLLRPGVAYSGRVHYHPHESG